MLPLEPLQFHDGNLALGALLILRPFGDVFGDPPEQIIAVLAYLQSLGGTPSVTMETTLADLGVE